MKNWKYELSHYLTFLLLGMVISTRMITSSQNDRIDILEQEVTQLQEAVVLLLEE